MQKISLSVLATFFLFACSNEVTLSKVQNSEVKSAEVKHIEAKHTKDMQLDTLYFNAVIWTGIQDEVTKTQIGIKDGRIEFIGSAEKKPPESNIQTNLNGAFVMPGFMDNHVHFMEGGTALASVDLRTAKNKTEFTQRIAQHVKKKTKGQWILNGNWDHEQWGGELPHRNWIDAITPEHPVYIIRIDGHMALLNTQALNLLNIDQDTPIPKGGEIVRDENGLTGILKGNALNLALEKIPQPNNEELMHAFSLAQEHALKLGLTHVHAVTAYPTETTMLDIFQMAQAQGILKLRAFVSTPIEHLDLATNAIKQGYGDRQLAWGGVKGFVDGSLGARTAWLYEPYADEPTSSGIPLNEPVTLAHWMHDANERELRLSIHAIGDQAIDSVLDTFVDITEGDTQAKRYRIEHFQHPSVAAMKRASELGVILSMHPYHAIDDGRWATNRLGPERIKTAYAFRSILDAGATLTFGSDWPVAPLNPLKGVYAAVTRRTTDGKNPQGWLPEQKISVEEALQAYTATNAYAQYLENDLGTLENGKYADFVVLSSDPRTIDPVQIETIKVLRTVINGESVFQRPVNH